MQIDQLRALRETATEYRTTVYKMANGVVLDSEHTLIRDDLNEMCDAVVTLADLVVEMAEALDEWQRIFPAHRAECGFLTERGCTCGLEGARKRTRAALASLAEVELPPR